MTTLPSHGTEGDPPGGLQHDSSDTENNNPDGWSAGWYKPVEEIGVGAYGVVYKACNTNPESPQKDQFVAMKCLRVENTEQGMPLSTVREIALLRQLESREHPNVVRLLDICTGQQTARETQLMLVFEYVDQDLDMFLKSSPESGIGSAKIKDIMWQMLGGLDFLHSMRVIHRDLKPQNVLITSSGEVKIADFGLARIYSFDMALTAVVVTLWYRAPEVLLQDSYSTPVDLWSIGCIFAELYNKTPLFRGTGDVNQLRKIFDFIGRPAETEWPVDVAIPIGSFHPQPAQPPRRFVPSMENDAISFLMKLLIFNPDRRLTAKAALEDPYFKPGSVASSEPTSFYGEASPALPVAMASSSSAHRRLPYTQQMSEATCSHSSRVYDPKYGYDAGHEGLDRPDSSYSSSYRRSDADSSEQRFPSHSAEKAGPSRQRVFGNPLPLTVKDGASGANYADAAPQGRAEDSAFLTPPSDLASSSSGFATSSSSRSSSTSSEVGAPTLAASSGEPAQQSTGFAFETSMYTASSASYDDASSREQGRSGLVQRRNKRESETVDQSRMSWSTDAVNESEEPGSAFLRPLQAPVAYDTPTHQRVAPPRKFPSSCAPDTELPPPGGD